MCCDWVPLGRPKLAPVGLAQHFIWQESCQIRWWSLLEACGTQQQAAVVKHGAAGLKQVGSTADKQWLTGVLLRVRCGGATTGTTARSTRTSRRARRCTLLGRCKVRVHPRLHEVRIHPGAPGAAQHEFAQNPVLRQHAARPLHPFPCWPTQPMAPDGCSHASLPSSDDMERAAACQPGHARCAAGLCARAARGCSACGACVCAGPPALRLCGRRLPCHITSTPKRRQLWGGARACQCSSDARTAPAR